uniref:Small-conductance mechanosensitive channel n=1 Tax=Aquisalinus luteolus TaxID=1566827 RepID=A0A8J3ET56_9PROT|nr:hypothetical protein GCM10011355_03540 [Aquisalinus luteolus]
MIAALFCLFACAAVPAAAQSMPSGGDEPASADRPGLFADIIDAIGSGSRMLIRKIQPGEERDRVEDPRFNSQESPRDSLMTFIEAMNLVQRGYTDIGYTRALASLPQGATRQQADVLYEILLRLGPVSPAELPGSDQAAASGDTRFEYFPRGTDHAWVWQAADPPSNATVAVLRSGEGTWLISERTLDGAPLFLESIADLPPQFSSEDNGEYFIMVFSPLIERTGLFGWIAFLAVFAIGIAAGLLFKRAMAWTARKADRIDQTFLGATLRGFGNAGGLVVFTFFFTIAIGFLALGPVLQALHYEIPRFLMVVAIAFLIVSLIDVFVAFLRERVSHEKDHYDQMVITMIRRILRVLVISIVLIFVLQNILGMNVGALLVGFGFLALALSLAAQDSVKNLFGAVSVFINRPFVIGDWICFKGEMGDHIGVIEDIELQATKLTDLAGNLVTLPNMLFIDREVQNLSARGYIRRRVDVAIPYRAHADEIDRALQAMMDVFDDEEVVEDSGLEGREEKAHVSFSGFDDSWLTITGYHYYFMGGEGEIQRDTDRGWFSYLSHCSLVNRKLVQLFGERDIEFAFPTQTVEIVPQKGEPITVRSTQSVEAD